jgi:cystathionine beta-lyase/cystathionine gamma-synthase
MYLLRSLSKQALKLKSKPVGIQTFHNSSRMAAFKENDSHFATKAIHEGQDPEQWTSMAVVPPISLATTFKQDGPADFKQ